MKRILLILMVGFIVPSGLNAQKVYKDVNGKVILDMTVAAGMPEGAVTTSPKTWKYAPVAHNAENVPNGRLNEKVYQKLEISKNDPGTKTWTDAWAYCQTSTEGGNSGWRLPTQRELQMMWIFKRALEGVGLTSFLAADYWSATEYNVSNVLYVYFDTGVLSPGGLGTFRRFRCVREVTD